MTLKKESIRKARLITLLTLYRSTAYDIIFFYPIQLVFLYQVRGISLAQNVFIESCFWLFNFIFMTVATSITEKISTKQATILGSILWILSICLYLQPASNYYFWLLIIAELIRALGLSLKSVADFSLVRDSLEMRGLYDNSVKGQKNYSIVEGYAMAINCAGDAIMAIVSVKLMEFNENLPMFICLISCVYGLVLSCMLPKQPKLQQIKTEKVPYRKIMSNKVIAAIIFHIALVYGTFCYWENLGKSLLQEIHVNSWTYGIILALLYVANSLGGILAGNRILSKPFKSKKQFITVLTMANIASFLVLGILGLWQSKIAITIIAVILFLQATVKTTYINNMKMSLQSQSNPMIASRISNLLFSSEHLGKAIIMSVASGIIEISSTAICYIALAIILAYPCTVISRKLIDD